MNWYNNATFYHIYPLGLTGAPKINDYSETTHRLKTLLPWIDHIKSLGFTALYIGPLFKSVGHGYETTDYKQVDNRLGDNDDLKDFVAYCHKNDRFHPLNEKPSVHLFDILQSIPTFQAEAYLLKNHRVQKMVHPT